MDSNLYLDRKIEINKEYHRLKEIEMDVIHHCYESPPKFASTKEATVDKKKPSPILVLESTSSEKLGSDLGPTMIVFNIVIFIVSIIFCTLAKFVTSIVFKNFKKSEIAQPLELSKTAPVETLPIGDTISVPISPSEMEMLKTTSSSNTELKQSTDQVCQTIFHTSVPLKYDQELRAECSKLRDQILILQSNSMKEHTVLSRKLEAMAKDKRDLNKRLSVILKENNVAKTQIEEIMEEKKQVQKRLENATKESRLHMKTKKVALARLEEVSVTVDDLKRQLEQVTRDKQILQGKLQVLRNEYEKMQERLRIMQLKETNRIIQERTATLDIEKAEKDENEDICIEKSNEDQSIHDSSQSSLNRVVSNENVYLPYVISQTEIDMKNIQRKILQLEESIKGFGPRTDILQELSRSDKDAEQETEVFNNKSLGEAEKPDEKLGSASAKTKTTKEDQTSRNSYDEMKLQLLRSALKEKIKILENLKDKGDEYSRNFCTSESTTYAEEEFEMFTEDANSSPRVVSNSQAFQRFLKNIGAETTILDFGDAKLNAECK